MTGPTCLVADCSRPTCTRGYCSSHYRHRLHTGRYGYRDAARAREHVARLREAGWTWEAIGKAAGVAPWTPHNLHRGTTRRLLAESEAALLSVPLVRFNSHHGIDATGARRRVQALGYMGWPAHEIARRAGCSRRSLPTLLSRGRISALLAARIAAVYRELAGAAGPSKYASGKARAHGFEPPWAWIPETIDDPQARPLTVLGRTA